jgi:hypothetical protein
MPLPSRESLKVSAFDSAYETTVGATVAMLRAPEYTAALHDPADHASIILASAKHKNPPSRILAGADAFDYGAADRVEVKLICCGRR